jgi:DNA polymerase V
MSDTASGDHVLNEQDLSRLAMMRLFVLPSALETASAPGDWLSRLNGWPMPSPTDASSPSSRTQTHGSGPMWIATPSS